MSAYREESHLVTVSARPEPGSKVVLEIEVPPADVDRYVADAYRTLARQTRVPGFRPGKAPRAVIDRHVGRGSVLAEAIEHLVAHGYEDALQQTDTIPIDQPEVDLGAVRLDEGAPVRFTATVPVRPEVTLGAYTDYPFTLQKAEVGEQQVDELIEQLREQHASLHPVEGRAAQTGDYATIRLASTIDGQPVEGGQSERLPLVLGESRLIPGLEEQIAGMTVGEERRFELPFPDDYPREALRGKRADFQVTLLDLREKRLPELDDGFAGTVSEKASNLAELRDEVRVALDRQAVAEARHTFADRIIEFATANAVVELPEVLISNEIEIMRDELRSRLARQRIGFEQYLEVVKQTPEELSAQLREPATRRVKSLLVLSAIAEREGVEATADEVEAEIAAQLDALGGEQRIAEYLRSVRGRSYLRMTIRNRKLVETLIERAIGPEPAPPPSGTGGSGGEPEVASASHTGSTAD